MAGQGAIAPHNHAVDAKADELAGGEVEDDSHITVVAGEEVSRLGMGVNKVDHDGHVAHVVHKVAAGGWADLHGIKVDSELLTVNGRHAEEFFQGQGTTEAFKVRPLRLTFKLLSKGARLSQASQAQKPKPAEASHGPAPEQLKQAPDQGGGGGGGAEGGAAQHCSGATAQWAQLQREFLEKAGRIARLAEDVHAMDPVILREEIETQDRLEQVVCALTERFNKVDMTGLRKLLAEREERKAYQWQVLEEHAMVREAEPVIDQAYLVQLRQELTEQEVTASHRSLATLERHSALHLAHLEEEEVETSRHWLAVNEQQNASHVARLIQEEVEASRQWLAVNEQQSASHTARLREEVQRLTAGEHHDASRIARLREEVATTCQGLAADQDRQALQAAHLSEEEALAVNEEHNAMHVARLNEQAVAGLEQSRAEFMEQEQRKAEAAWRHRVALEASLAASQEEVGSLRAELGALQLELRRAEPAPVAAAAPAVEDRRSSLQPEAALGDHASLEASLAASQEARRELQDEVASLRAKLERPHQEAKGGRLPAELEEEAQVKAALAEVQTIAEFSQRFRRIDLELLQEELAHQASLEHLVGEVNAAKSKLEHHQLESSIEPSCIGSEDSALHAREDADRVQEENEALRQALAEEAEEYAMMRQLDCCYGLEQALVIELRNRVRQARDEVSVSAEIATQERALASRFQEELEEVEAAAIETADVAEASVDALQQEVHGLERALRREREARGREAAAAAAEQQRQQSEQWPGEAPPAPRRPRDDAVALQGQGASGALLNSRGGSTGGEGIRGAAPPPGALPPAGGATPALLLPPRRAEDVPPALPAATAGADEALTATARAEAQKLRREAELLRRVVQDWRTTHTVGSAATRAGLPGSAAPSALGGPPSAVALTQSAGSQLDPLVLPSALVQPPPLPPPALPSEQ